MTIYGIPQRIGFGYYTKWLSKEELTKYLKKYNPMWTDKEIEQSIKNWRIKK